MIKELRIKNLALIEDVLVDFEEGFSVFTGETGAGKSILVGAIGLLLGERASSELVRSGAEEAEVSGVFDLNKMSKPLRDSFSAGGIPDEGGTCILRRVVARSGKNRAYINQVPVPLSALKAVGDNLVDFHGQHEHQSLLDPQNALRIIDRLPTVEPLRRDYDGRFSAYTAARDALDTHDKKSADLAAKRDVIEFQYDELKTLSLAEGDEQRLEEELRLLSSTAQRCEYAAGISRVLSGDENSLDRQISLVKKNLELLARYDASVQPWITDLANSVSVFSELESFCAKYLQRAQVDVDPGRLDDINSRIAKIQRLKKKHGCDFAGLLTKVRLLKADLDALVNTGADRSALEARAQEAMRDCARAGGQLSSARRKRARAFDGAIGAEMAKLGFSAGEWKTEFSAHDGPTPHGCEDAAFLVLTNPGEPMLPLIKIASGGEISRLMLAIKTVMASHDHIPVLIFDEIDAGIGGMLAKEVGKSLSALSATHQLLCISHLHQIASMADHHYRVYKEAQGQRTVTLVRKLDEQEKVAEIARMLGGDSAISKKHAAELLKRK